MPKKVLTAAEDTITILLPNDSVGVVAAQIDALQSTGAAVDATAAVVLEASVNEVDFVTPVRMRDPVAGADADSLVGPNASGWADLPNYTAVRLRCTVFAGTDIPVRLEAK